MKKFRTRLTYRLHKSPPTQLSYPARLLLERYLKDDPPSVFLCILRQSHQYPSSYLHLPHRWISATPRYIRCQIPGPGSIPTVPAALHTLDCTLPLIDIHVLLIVLQKQQQRMKKKSEERSRKRKYFNIFI